MKKKILALVVVVLVAAGGGLLGWQLASASNETCYRPWANDGYYACVPLHPGPGFDAFEPRCEGPFPPTLPQAVVGRDCRRALTGMIEKERLAHGHGPPTPTAATLRSIARSADQASVSAGEKAPTDGIVVATTRGALSNLLAGDGTADDYDLTPVYAVVLHGRFTAPDGPEGAPPATGTVLVLAVERRDYRTLDLNVQTTAPDLSAFGRVVALPAG